MLEMTDESQNAEKAQRPLAMWEADIQYIELEKGSKGLGFSILDYQVNISYFQQFFLKVDAYMLKRYIVDSR